ncbi:MAG: hypothetical protein J7M08_08795 [Planctomycetes bacterium]|nr:hypothetical protein [Planctomycetota bacterium]
MREERDRKSVDTRDAVDFLVEEFLEQAGRGTDVDSFVSRLRTRRRKGRRVIRFPMGARIAAAGVLLIVLAALSLVMDAGRRRAQPGGGEVLLSLANCGRTIQQELAAAAAGARSAGSAAASIGAESLSELAQVKPRMPDLDGLLRGLGRHPDSNLRKENL